ncbi:MAG: PEGA domain-containing protein, partial [Bacteroidales bacterium]
TAAPVASSAQAPVSVSSRGIEEVHEALSPAVIPDSVAIGSIFGHRDDEQDVAGEQSREKSYALPWKNQKTVRIGLGVAALLLVCVGGYFGLGLLTPAKTQATTGTVNVESQPAGLAVKIDGKPRGTTPLKIALPPGPHRLELETGGEPRVIPITVTAGAQMSQYIEAPAVPITGRLQITSEPPGAVVSIDGVRKGPAPILVSELTVGRHKIDLLGADGTTVQQETTVEAGATNSLVVPMSRQSGPVSGWLTVSSPVDVQVYEGGKLVGTSQSEKLLMTAGKHDLELVNETVGFRGTQAVQVMGGKTAIMKVQLPKGSLNVNAVPWAEVLIDGERAGETPLGNVSLTVGPHEITFRHPQFPEQRHAVTVTTKAAARISVDLRK